MTLRDRLIQDDMVEHEISDLIDYSAFNLDGPEHKQADQEIRNAIADGLLKAMGLPGLVRSQTEQEKQHAQTQRGNKEE